MSISIELTQEGLDRVTARLQGLSEFDFQELLEALGTELESQTRRRISEEKTAPDGTPWPDWTERYAGSQHGSKSHRKHKSELREADGHSLLELSGALLDSIQYRVDNDNNLIVGSSMVYAARHQMGFEDITPAREFLGLSQENEDDLMAVVETFVGEALR